MSGKRWFRCTSPDYNEMDVLESSPEDAAREALETWMGEDEDDGDPFWDCSHEGRSVVKVVPITNDGKDDGDPTTWTVTVRRRVIFESRAERVDA